MKKRVKHLIIGAILDITIYVGLAMAFAGLGLYMGFIFGEPIMGIAVGTPITLCGAMASIHEVKETADIINEITKEA